MVFAPWMIRNMYWTGKPCPTGCYRNALQWYVRGERSETLRGWEPARCLWSEYMSRNWTGRSPNCSFNAVWHLKWPQGFVGVPEDAIIAKNGQKKIIQYFPFYLWDSLFEVAEFHFPFVGPWGHIYNMLETLALLILYVGCACAAPVFLQKELRYFVVLCVYLIALFSLTDATPRYHMPIIFCYALFASIGYDRCIARIYGAYKHRRTGV